LDMLREGDVFVVYKLDRLARSVKHLYEIMDIIRKKNVQFGFLCPSPEKGE